MNMHVRSKSAPRNPLLAVQQLYTPHKQGQHAHASTAQFTHPVLSQVPPCCLHLPLVARTAAACAALALSTTGSTIENHRGGMRATRVMADRGTPGSSRGSCGRVHGSNQYVTR